MTPVELIGIAFLRGVRLYRAGSSVGYESPGPLPADLRDLLVRHKPAVLEYLAMNPPVSVVVASSGPSAVGGVWVGGRWFPPAPGPEHPAVVDSAPEAGRPDPGVPEREPKKSDTSSTAGVVPW